MGKTLLQKVWDAHAVRQLPTGQTQLFIGLHLVHEVTSPQAFDMLRARGWTVAFPDRTFATVDHIVPTTNRQRPFLDTMAEQMITALEHNCRAHGISQVRDVLASGCLAMEPLKVRRITVNGRVPHGVYAKDVILTVIQRLGVKGGAGFAYEYAGDTVERMSMDERMTICNMSIEGAARVGYVNPDTTTFEYLRDRPFAPAGKDFDEAVRWWSSMASDADARFDDEVTVDAETLEPTVTWGINPGQSIGIGGRIPSPADVLPSEQAGVAEALAFMGFEGGAPIAGTPIDVAFVGSCTNSRLSDLREAARVVAGGRVAPHVRALVVPGSERVRRAAEREGLHEVFQAAGFEWRGAGCSMCLAMNPDRLQGREICASSSNRNFKGRQGSPTGRTLLMSPAMVAAAAIAGEVVDVRQVLAREEVGA